MDNPRTVNDSAVKDMAVDVSLALAKWNLLRACNSAIVEALRENEWIGAAKSLCEKGEYDAAYCVWKQNYDKLQRLLAVNCVFEPDEVAWETAKSDRRKLKEFLEGPRAKMLDLLRHLNDTRLHGD